MTKELHTPDNLESANKLAAWADDVESGATPYPSIYYRLYEQIVNARADIAKARGEAA